MLKKTIKIIVNRDIALDMLKLQNIALDKFDKDLSKNELCKIAICELIAQINEDEIKLGEILRKYKEERWI